MKTNISREARVNILDNAVRQQALCDKLGEIVNVYPDDYGLHLSVLIEALYGVDVDNISNDEYDAFYNIFNDTIKLDKMDFKEKANLIDERIVSKLSFVADYSEPQTPSKDFKVQHEGTIKAIISDAIVFDRITEDLSVLSSNYFVGKGCLDFAQNVKGFTKAYALMGIDDRDSNHDIQFELEGIYRLALGRDMNSDHPNSTDHLVLAEQIYDSWMKYLSKGKAA